MIFFFFFQAEDGIRDKLVTGVQTCALPISERGSYLSGMKLVLFDIDGTLLWTDGAGRRAIHGALLAEAGTAGPIATYRFDGRSEEHTSELQSLAYLVCRLLLEKKKKKKKKQKNRSKKIRDDRRYHV